MKKPGKPNQRDMDDRQRRADLLKEYGSILGPTLKWRRENPWAESDTSITRPRETERDFVPALKMTNNA